MIFYKNAWHGSQATVWTPVANVKHSLQNLATRGIHEYYGLTIILTLVDF